MRRAVAVLVALEAVAFGVGVAWVLFAGSLLQADIDGGDLLVPAVLCVVHLAAAVALSSDRSPRAPLYAVLALQVPIVVWASTRGEPVFYALAALATAVLVSGLRAAR